MKRYLNAWDKPEIRGDEIYFKPEGYNEVRCYFDFTGTPDTNPEFGSLYYIVLDLKPISYVMPATDKQKEYLTKYSSLPRYVINEISYEDAKDELMKIFEKRKRW